MKQRCEILGIVVAATLMGGLVGSRVCAQELPHNAPMRREVHGTVTDSATQKPLFGVSVKIGGTEAGVVTDSVGHYRLAGLFPSPATVVFSQIGYATITRQVDVTKPVQSMDVALEPRAIRLDGLSLTVDRERAAFLGAQQASSTMSATDVAEQRGQTLVETIKEQPGVSVIQYGPSIAKPVVRGLHSQRIATVNAGVPLEGQQWGAEHAPEVDAFAANQIQVIRGPGTILYGSGALGGVVRVIPRPLPIEGGISGELAANSFWNNRQAAASFLLEGADLPLPAIGAVGWRAQVSARRAGDARTPDYYLPNTGFSELDFNAAAGVTRPWGRSTLNFSHYSTHLGLYLGAHVSNLDDLQRAMENAYTTSEFAYDVGHPDQKVRHELFSWQTEINLPHTSRLDLSYGYQYNDRREFDSRGFLSGSSRPAFALQLYTHTLDVQYHHPSVGPLSGTLGLSGTRQGNLSPGRSFLIPQYRLYAGGVFALEELNLSRLTVTGGVRTDYRWQHAYQYGAPVVISPDDEQSYTGISGSLGTTFRITDTWSLAGTVGRAWRPPNVNERFSQGVHHGTAQYEIGDTSLVPERSFNMDATLRHLGPRTRLEVSVYRNRIDDYIFLRPREPIYTVRGTYPAYAYAHADALLRGLEVTAEATPAEWLALYTNYNIVRGTDRVTGEPLYDMPADRLTASVRLYAGNSDHFVGPWLEIGTTQVFRQSRVPSVTIYSLPTDAYGLLDLEIGATTVRFRGLEVEPSLALRNVLDTPHRDYLSRYRLFVDDPGRDIVLRLTMPFRSPVR